MVEPQLSIVRKRPHSEQHKPPVDGTSQFFPKRQKYNGANSESPPPAAFWDNLSKVWLTKRALRELDRRNNQNTPRTPYSLHRQSRQPVTQRIIAELGPSSRYPTDIKLFAKQGGPDLSDLRGCSKSFNPRSYRTTSSHPTSEGQKRGWKSASNIKHIKNTTDTTSTTSSGPYDCAFQQHLIDNGIFPEYHEYPDDGIPPLPANWDEINERLIQPRRSLSPSKFSDEAFKIFKRENRRAFKEKQVDRSVIGIIEGDIGNNSAAGGIPFTDLDPLTDGMISPARPDLFYGAHPEQLKLEHRSALDRQISPSTQKELPLAPNFFLAVKGPYGTDAVVGRQACYAGALGARGIQSLQSCGQSEPVYDKNAYTITCTYLAGTLKLYTSHLDQPASHGGRPEYYMNQLSGYALTSDPGTFRLGATAFRNARDWAKEKRDECIEAANRLGPNIHMESQSLGSSGHKLASGSTAGPALVQSDTSADELALDNEKECTPLSKRPRRER